MALNPTTGNRRTPSPVVQLHIRDGHASRVQVFFDEHQADLHGKK